MKMLFAFVFLMTACSANQRYSSNSCMAYHDLNPIERGAVSMSENSLSRTQLAHDFSFRCIQLIDHSEHKKLIVFKWPAGKHTEEQLGINYATIFDMRSMKVLELNLNYPTGKWVKVGSGSSPVGPQ